MPNARAARSPVLRSRPCPPGAVRPSRTPAAGNGAAWNEREALSLDGRLAGHVGGGPCVWAAGSPSLHPLSCLPRVVCPSRTAAGDAAPHSGGHGGSHRAARWPCWRRPARPGGGIPGRGPAAALSAPGRYVRVRPPGSLLPGSCRSLVVPCRPNAPRRSSTSAWMHACCGQPRHHAAGLSRPLTRSLLIF